MTTIEENNIACTFLNFWLLKQGINQLIKNTDYFIIPPKRMYNKVKKAQN